MLPSIAVLKKNNLKFEEIVLSTPVHSAEDVMHACQCELGQVIKSLVISGDQNSKIVLVTGDRKLDLTKLQDVCSDTSLRLANSVEVQNITGSRPGSVSPIINNTVQIIIDRRALDFETVFIGSGKSDLLISLRVSDLVAVTKGEIMAISQ